MGKTLAQQEIIYAWVSSDYNPVYKGSSESALKKYVDNFWSLNYVIRWSNNAYYIWFTYYVLGALYNLTHLSFLIITM